MLFIWYFNWRGHQISTVSVPKVDRLTKLHIWEREVQHMIQQSSVKGWEIYFLPLCQFSFKRASAELQNPISHNTRKGQNCCPVFVMLMSHWNPCQYTEYRICTATNYTSTAHMAGQHCIRIGFKYFFPLLLFILLTVVSYIVYEIQKMMWTPSDATSYFLFSIETVPYRFPIFRHSVVSYTLSSTNQFFHSDCI